MSQRLRAAGAFAAKHLGVSLAIALVCAALVFGLWYPYPYGTLASGRELFLILVAVDVVMGPALSLVVYDPRKPRSELVRDIGVIVLLQLAALAYGLYSVTQARPVWLAFEGDRFRVVSVPDIDPGALGEAPPALQRLSWTGPKPVGVRLLANDDPDYLKSLQLAFEGLHPAFRPQRWVDYDTQRAAVIREARPIAQLKRRRPGQSSLIETAVRASGFSEAQLGYLPLAAMHHTDWVVVVTLRDGEPRFHLPVDAWE